MTRKALVLLADGFEEVEAVTTIDVLRRGMVKVTLAKVGDGPVARGLASESPIMVKGAHGLCVVADAHLRDTVALIEEYSAIILPGGGEAAKSFCKVC